MEPGALYEMADFWPARILLSAVELKLFPELGVPVAGEVLAARLGLDEHATQLLLDALTGLEVLHKSAGHYELSPELRRSLLPGEHSLLPALEHRAVLWRRWSLLTDVVRSGQVAGERYEDDLRPLSEVRSFIGAMAIVGRPSARETAAALDWDGVASVLDVGGGPGVYAMEFLALRPQLKAVILDLPRVCDIARENLAGTPFAERVAFCEGEALAVADADVLAASPGGYDLVFTSNLIHSLPQERVRALIRRLAGWCAPGGRVVVKDFLLDDTRTRPTSAAVFAINMLVGGAGRCYTWSEVEQWLTDALAAVGGVVDVQHIALPDGRSGMVVARRG